MRYYIADNQGNIYGDFANYEKAKNSLTDTIEQLKNEKTIEEIEKLELEIIEGDN